MKTVLVTEENERMFKEVLPYEILKSGDLFLGAIDEETDTACGILTAMVDSEANLNISYIYVAEDFRMRRAGTGLVEALKQFAVAGQAETISCIHERETLSNGVYELLESCGFILLDAATTTTYEVRLSDIKAPAKEMKYDIISLREVTGRQWALFKKAVEKLAEEDEEGKVFSPAEKSFYDADISSASISASGKITGALLLDINKGEINVDALTVLDGDAKRLCPELVNTSLEAARKRFSEWTMVVISPLSEEHRSLMNDLLQDRGNIRSETVVQFFGLGR